MHPCMRCYRTQMGTGLSRGWCRQLRPVFEEVNDTISVRTENLTMMIWESHIPAAPFEPLGSCTFHSTTIAPGANTRYQNHINNCWPKYRTWTSGLEQNAWDFGEASWAWSPDLNDNCRIVLVAEGRTGAHDSWPVIFVKDCFARGVEVHTMPLRRFEYRLGLW